MREGAFVMGIIQMKRVYDQPEETDGFRILVDRLWPRGISKEKAKLDLWAKNIAPSKELRGWYGHQPERFAEFSGKYRAELDENPDTADFRKLVDQKRQEENVTLLYGAKDGTISNAAVLLEYLTE